MAGWPFRRFRLVTIPCCQADVSTSFAVMHLQGSLGVSLISDFSCIGAIGSLAYMLDCRFEFTAESRLHSLENFHQCGIHWIAKLLYGLALLATTTTVQNYTQQAFILLSTPHWLICIFLFIQNLPTIVLCSFSFGLGNWRLDIDIGRSALPTIEGGEGIIHGHDHFSGNYTAW